MDDCKITIFFFNKELYKQVDGVSMGCYLGSAVVNIIMT